MLGKHFWLLLLPCFASSLPNEEITHTKRDGKIKNKLSTVHRLMSCNDPTGSPLICYQVLSFSRWESKVGMKKDSFGRFLIYKNMRCNTAFRVFGEKRIHHESWICASTEIERLKFADGELLAAIWRVYAIMAGNETIYTFFPCPSATVMVLRGGDIIPIWTICRRISLIFLQLYLSQKTRNIFRVHSRNYYYCMI